VIAHRGAETSTTLAYLKSAERFYEPSELGSLGRQRVRLRAPLNRASVGRCATLGLRARPAPDPSALTFLNWGITDISIWAGQAERGREIIPFDCSISNAKIATMLCSCRYGNADGRRRVRKRDRAMTDIPLQITAKTAKRARGRPFPKGQSGKPAGRPRGSSNRATGAAEMLLDGEATALTRKAVELALAGDQAALRLFSTAPLHRAANGRSSSRCRRSTAQTTSWPR
jgi:hypothetical protein